MHMVEREIQLAELAAALQDVRSGFGSVVLVTGEAGTGKTTLVRHFGSEVAAECNVLTGMCDEFATPRPLGPFRDIADRLGIAVDRPDGSGPHLFDSLLAEMGRSPRGTVVVVEDAHWADEATLDGIRFLGRRVRLKPAIIVVTFRDNEVSPGHPLRSTIGAIPPDDIRRITLPRLSQHGVALLAGREDVDDVYHLTEGNPFYVTEVLAAPDVAVPATVQDAIMARISRLGEHGRATAEVASVLPGGAERWILDVCGVADGVDEAADLGVLRPEGDTVRFSHELARRAVENQLAPGRRQQINAAVLDALTARDEDPARTVHHAVMAGDACAIARFAPAAADQAAALNSHREAAAHLRKALEHEALFSPQELAKHWYQYGLESHLTGRHDVAENALRRAAEINESIGDTERLGASLSLLSEALWFLGKGDAARDVLARAAAELAEAPPGPALAWVYAHRARLAMVDWRENDASEWGKKAIELARTVGNIRVQAHAMNTVGMVRWLWPPFDDRTVLESVEFALEHEATFPGLAGRAYINLATGYLDRFDYEAAGRCLEEGLAYCAKHDLIAGQRWLSAHRAMWHFEQGRWSEAEEEAEGVLATEGDPSRVAMLVLGLLQARRGDAHADDTLAEVQQVASSVGDRQTLIPVGIARLERAWLGDRLQRVARLADDLHQLATDGAGSLHFDHAAVWLWLHRVGVDAAIPSDLYEPYALQIAGRWREAAAFWGEIGRPYAQADALADADEVAPLFAALDILDRLGARPRAAAVRKKLVDLGVSTIPRGPRESTRANPAGLTSRQAEVLRLLADDLTYQEIAERLFLSVKTVDHHAAAVRAKLDVSTRDEAVAAARRLGILAPDDAR